MQQNSKAQWQNWVKKLDISVTSMNITSYTISLSRVSNSDRQNNQRCICESW